MGVVDKNDTQKQLAMHIAALASVDEREALKAWIQSSLSIVNSNISSISKIKSLTKLTASNKILLPTLKLISKAIKQYGWDNHSAKLRRASAVAILTLVTLGGQSAGIAALGGAIGVPLWMVFGAGAAFLPVLYAELMGKDKSASQVRTTYTVIDADKDE